MDLSGERDVKNFWVSVNEFMYVCVAVAKWKLNLEFSLHTNKSVVVGTGFWFLFDYIIFMVYLNAFYVTVILSDPEL